MGLSFGGGLGFGFTSDDGSGGGGVTGASNGLSLNGTDVVLGQDVGAVGNPAQLVNQREIPLNLFGLSIIDKVLSSQFVVDFANRASASLIYNSNVLGTFAAYVLSDTFSGAALGISNDAGGNITFTNQAAQVMAFTPAANVVVGTQGTTQTLNVFGANNGSSQFNNALLSNGRIFLTGDSSATVPPSLNLTDNSDSTSASIAYGNDQLILDAFQILLRPNNTSFAEVLGSLVVDSALQAGTIQAGDPGLGAGVWQLGTVVTAASVLDTTKYVQIKIGTTVIKVATMQ